MLIQGNGSEAIETVYTYDEWLKEYNRRKSRRKNKRRIERLYYIKQRFVGVIMIAMGIIIPFIVDGDVTISLFVLPLGIFLLLTKEKVMIF